jgi:hypothetical protein
MRRGDPIVSVEPKVYLNRESSPEVLQSPGLLSEPGHFLWVIARRLMWPMYTKLPSARWTLSSGEPGRPKKKYKRKHDHLR